MDHNLKQLIRKFILNECTSEEVDLLVEYFQKGEMDVNFPIVEEILEGLKKKEQIDEHRAEKIFEEIWEEIELRKNIDREKSIRLRRKRLYRYITLAALFVGLIGIGFMSNFFNIGSSKTAIVNQSDVDVIKLETEDGQIIKLTDLDQFQDKITADGINLVKEENVLRYKAKTYVEPKKVNYNTLIVPNGKRFELELADGSYIMLNAGSSLRYPVNFPTKGNREVYLNGEAFFRASKDVDRPFIVHTEEVSVEVLGTEFTVSAFEGDGLSDVVLIEGSVNLMAKNEAVDDVILKPGQLGKVKKNEAIKVEVVDTKLYTAWMDGSMVFRNERFEDILKRMERHYKVIIINQNKDLGETRFNANFGPAPLSQILDYFNTIYGLDYIQPHQDTLIINPKN